MKKEYVKPSMAMNLFETTDYTNVNVLSAVAQKQGRIADTYGISVLNGSKLNS